MSVSNPVGFKAFPITAGTVELYKRVSLNVDGTVSHAAGNVRGIGTVIAVNDKFATVQLYTSGTAIVTVGTGGISAGSILYATTGGDVGGTAVTPAIVGIAAEHGSAGDAIEFIPATGL
jgi:hypothetical protein